MASYYVYVLDSNGNTVVQGENVNYTSGSLDATLLTPNTIYTARIGALPVNGTTSDMVEKTARFMVAPQPTAAPTPTAQAGIDASSTVAEVKDLQEMLASVGLMEDGSADGKYGAQTTEAVRKLQVWRNEKADAGRTVSGECDPDTLARLKALVEDDVVVQVPTPAPTDTPAPTPEITPEPNPDFEGGEVINADSDAEAIYFVQQMLTQVGLLPLLELFHARQGLGVLRTLLG